jgi:ADP-ribose pyrophosphatase
MKKLDEKVIHKGSRICLVVQDLEVRGVTVQKEIVRHPGAVVILPMSDRGTFFLVRQWRPALEKYILELPAGTLDAGEQPAICAERELKEEIGGVATSWEAVGTFVPSPGFCDEVLYGYLAKGVTLGEQNLFADEEMTVEEFSAEQLKALIASGEVGDAKTIALFCRAQVCGLI